MSESPLCRRSFMSASAVLGLTAVSHARQPLQPATEPTPRSTSDFPRQPDELVRMVVGAAHRDLDKVKELVEKSPALARASWDWGFGDWETALGAAAHTGQRAIATYLIERGARPDIFTFAMLGDLDSVRAMINAHPGVQRIPGPHGIPLLRHAAAGGPNAEEVRKYLESLKDAGNEPQDFPLTPEQVLSYLGTFKLEGEEGITFIIKNVKGKLALQRGEQSQIMLRNHTAFEFSPAGALEVRLNFEMKDGKAVSVTGRNHIADFKAIRVEE